MVMVVNLVFDNHPFTYAGKDGEHKDAGGKLELAQELHIDGLHSRDADRLWNADRE